MSAIRGVASLVPVTVCVLMWAVAGASQAAAEPPDTVRISLREASALASALSCALDVVTSSTAGEAILICTRTSPLSHLGAHRALTTSEAARLYALSTELVQMRPHRAEADSAAMADGLKAALVVVRGNERVTLDVSQGPKMLSDRDQQTWQILRSIVDELRGSKR